MPRRLRVEYEGAIYHVMNRGDRREPIFRDDRDRELFLKTLGNCCEKTDWGIHAYCLMPNHFHAVIETPKANLVTGMKWFLGTYTMRFNYRHKLSGHLFGGRYKSLIVDGSGNGYLRTVCDYVHLNPVRAKLLKPGEALSDFCWSSYPYYLKTSRQRPPWIRVDRLFGEVGIPRDTRTGRRQFEMRMDRCQREENPTLYRPLRQGWYFGDDAFRKELLDQVIKKVGHHHYGSEREESSQEKADRIIAEELRRRGWTLECLKRRDKGDPQKIQIAQRLRAETVMTLKWIAHRLHMGSSSHVFNCISRIQSAKSED
jgi:putative transposase